MKSKISLKRVNFLFLSWMLTLPFGSKLAGLSLGFFTIYPSLIFSGLLFLLLPISVKMWGKFEKTFSIFLFFWLIYGICLGGVYGFHKNAIFDIRHLFLQLIFFVSIFNVFHLLDRQTFLKSLLLGLWAFLIMLIGFGFFEFFTGIHFESYKTNEMLSLAVGNSFYAPMFIYENQNTFLVYIIFIYLLLFLFDERLKKNTYTQLLIVLVIYFFTAFADSSFSKIICLMLFCFSISRELYNSFNPKNLKKYLFYAVSFLCLIATFFSNEIFLGPQYENSKNYRINELNIINENENGSYELSKANEKLSKKEQIKLINDLDSINKNNPEKSFNIRKNLILNGLCFIKEKPVLGLGPGGYEQRCLLNKKKYFVASQVSPHNFPIEIISKYGIFGWLYFLFLGVLVYKSFLRRKTIPKMDFAILLLFLFSIPFLWLMPSSYMLLQTHKILMPMLCIYILLINGKNAGSAV